MSRLRATTRPLGVAILTASLCACVGLPTYQPSPGEPLATIRLSANIATDPLDMCNGGTCYVLKPAHGELQVPVDRRVVLYKVLVASGYQVMYSCTPALSFVPHVGVTYYADFALRAEHCVLSLFRLDPGSRVGVAFDPTVRAMVPRR